MADTGKFRGETGVVFTFDLPLSEVYADQLAKGRLTRVDEAVDEPKLTPKQELQAQARELGLDAGGTVAELQERIDAKLAE